MLFPCGCIVGYSEFGQAEGGLKMVNGKTDHTDHFCGIDSIRTGFGLKSLRGYHL